jgi:hypothetical protein
MIKLKIANIRNGLYFIICLWSSDIGCITEMVTKGRLSKPESS